MCNKHKWVVKNSYGITPYMQNLMLLSGQTDNYLASEVHIKQFLRIEVDDSQICRLSNVYGAELEEKEDNLKIDIEQRGKDLAETIKANEVVYSMLDGCMLPTRPNEVDGEKIKSWREMKLGRVFSQRAHIEIEGKRNWIRESLYVSHFGKHDAFTAKFEQVLDPFEKLQERLVFVTDGASWINNWITTFYPKATSILDFYHAVEYLHTFSKILFPKKTKQEEKEKWLTRQKLLLLNDGIESVITEIKSLDLKGKGKQAAQDKIITYYTNNQHRMYYQTYKERGLLIGSGPIESAHRFVLQKRMKQSGQKWTVKGGQAVANLRVAYLNNQWDNVIQLIQAKNTA